MILLRQQCAKALEPFILSFQEVCEDRNLMHSLKLYQMAVEVLLLNIPEQTSRKITLTQRKINLMVEKLSNENKSSCDAILLCLHRLIEICKKSAPKYIEGKVVLRKRLRPEEIGIHNQVAFELMDDYCMVRAWLSERITTVPRDKKKLPELIITSLIAINGIVMNNAQTNLSALKLSNLKKGSVYWRLDVPYAKHLSQKPQFVRYPLLNEIEMLIKHLPHHENWLFNHEFHPGDKLYKKIRVKRLNAWLNELWVKALGYETPIHPSWNIATFIRCSQMYFTLKSTPSMASFLARRTSFARLEEMNMETDVSMVDEQNQNKVYFQDEFEVTENVNNDTDALLVLDLIDEVTKLLHKVNHKSQLSKNRESVSFELLGILVRHELLMQRQPSLRLLMGWLVSELNKTNDKRRFGAFRRLWSLIPKMIVSELACLSPLDLDELQWKKFIEYLIHENNFAPSTQQKVKQHLKSFYSYLCTEYPDQMPYLNWRSSEFRVTLVEKGELIPTLGEFETLFNAAVREKDTAWSLRLQATLVLAFLGGLRVEEICLLSKQDVPENLVHIQVWWSKTKMGRRRIPLALLLPTNNETKSRYSRAIKLLRNQCERKETFLFRYEDDSAISPDVLGKRVRKLIEENLSADRKFSIHTLRHGFASWLMVRYFVLQHPELLQMKGLNGKFLIPDNKHVLFSHSSQYNLVRVFNGRVAGDNYLKEPTSFFPKPEHFAYISRLVGHATRATTAKTYIHCMEWLAFFYISKLK